MTRVAGPLARFIKYDHDKEQVSVRAGRSAGDPNGALLARRIAWTEVEEAHREAAPAALRRKAAQNLLPGKLLQAAQQRRRAAVARLASRGMPYVELRVRPAWRLVVGLGEETPEEVGLRLHGTYGVPVLPGSALKGVTRATARDDTHDYADYGTDAFGHEPGDTDKAKAGAVVFLDALPVVHAKDPEPIQIDVVNPHVPGYYRSDGQLPPAEYEQPVPVAFLTVSSAVEFRVHVLGRGDVERAELILTLGPLCKWLDTALAERGIGAKTNAGYGYLVVEEDGEVDAR